MNTWVCDIGNIWGEYTRMNTWVCDIGNVWVCDRGEYMGM